MTPAANEPASRIRAVAIIPARLASQRLSNKMLLAETGLPLVVHTARNVARAGCFERVVVATDDASIASAVRAHDFEAVMTRADHPSGTDRVHEAVRALTGQSLLGQSLPHQSGGKPGAGAKPGGPIDVAVNVQGDEPELDVGDLERLVAAFADPAVEFATLAGPLASAAEAELPQVVKVLCDRAGNALYFSRAPIPHRAHGPAGDAPQTPLARRHVGVYAFRPDALAEFCALPPGDLERTENLEQLRWLEAGRRIRVLDTEHVPLGIDTRSDYDAFVQRALPGDGPLAH